MAEYKRGWNLSHSLNSCLLSPKRMSIQEVEPWGPKHFFLGLPSQQYCIEDYIITRSLATHILASCKIGILGWCRLSLLKQLTLRSSELVEIIVLSLDFYLFTSGFDKAEVNEAVGRRSPGGKCNLEGAFRCPLHFHSRYLGISWPHLLSKIRLTE